MKSSNRLSAVYVAAGLMALGWAPRPAAAQAGGAAPQPPARAAAVDSNTRFAGDWEFTMLFRDSTVTGGWHINYAQGRFTGVVAKPGAPPTPIRSLTIRNGRDMQLEIVVDGDPWTFNAHLENPTHMTGSVSFRGGVTQLRAQKRG